MKSKFAIFFVCAIVLAGSATTASAKGCLEGAAVGAVAGHYAGGHAVVGALGGCVVGRKLANRKAADQKAPAATQTTPGQV